MCPRKIATKKPNARSSRQVTFSKLRTELFNEANELATLFAAQILIVVFSPEGKVFSFASPNVPSIVNRFLNKGDKVPQLTRNTQEEAQVRKLQQRLNDLLKQIKDENERGERIKKALKAYKPNKELNFEELVTRKTKLEQLKNDVKRRKAELEASSSSLIFPKNTNDQKNNED